MGQQDALRLVVDEQNGHFVWVETSHLFVAKLYCTFGKIWTIFR